MTLLRFTPTQNTVGTDEKTMYSRKQNHNIARMTTESDQIKFYPRHTKSKETHRFGKFFEKEKTKVKEAPKVCNHQVS